MTTTASHDPAHRIAPELRADRYVTDGGLETFLIFERGLDLPEFAAFPLLDSADGVAELEAYFDRYLDIAERDGHGLVVDTPTWRANRDWGAALGYDREALERVNRRAVDLARSIARRRPAVATLVSGTIGPRGDGYVVDDVMSARGAAKYHWLQVGAFADAGADVVTAVTMTYAAEAAGIAQAARSEGVPVVIGFTVETDGRLPSGQPLLDAIAEVDDASDGAVAWFMVNCAHPSHFWPALDADDPTLARIGAIRANASRMSHEELDAATELDRGDPAELAEDYLRLDELLPNLCVVGGCCGTDHDHIDHLSRALAA